ncbi:hypothetical protein CL657_04570 [bacterium]|nr:hypothetical protein [bacterium]
MFLKFLFFVFFLFYGSFNLYASFSDLSTDLERYHGIKAYFPKVDSFDVVVSSKALIFHLQEMSLIGKNDTNVTYKNIVVNARNLRYNLADNTLSFDNDVLVKRDDLSLICDNARISFPKTVHVSGDVRVLYEEYIAEANTARYDIERNQISLQGDAVLYDSFDYVKAHKIDFDLKNESVKTSGRSKINVSTKQLAE